MSDRTTISRLKRELAATRRTITRLTRELAATRWKFKEAQDELKWRRKALRGSRAEQRHASQVRAECDAISADVKRMLKAKDRVKKVTALANDGRGNAHERAVAAAIAAKLRAKGWSETTNKKQASA
jgi:hypothetical protein